MYELLNIKWGVPTYGTPSGPITWSDDLSGLPVASGSTTNDLVASLNDAFQDWEDVAAVNFVESSGFVDLFIGYASFSTDGNPLNDGAAGVASWTPPASGFGEPTNVSIVFNSDEVWSPFVDSDPTTINFNAVALHEIGHILGLAHVDDPNQIMNEIIFVDELADGDIEGAQEIYGLDGDDVPVDSGSGSFSGGGGGGGGGAAGLLLGLLAALFGLFTGGIGAAAVVAAGRIASDDDDPSGAHDVHDHGDHDHDHDDLPEGYHVAFLPQIPVEEFEATLPLEDDEDETWLL